MFDNGILWLSRKAVAAIWTTPRACHDEVTAVRRPKRVLHDSNQIATASSAVQTVANPQITSQWKDAALEKMALPLSRVQSKDTLKQ